MELKINDKDIEIIFGLAFNRELDTVYKVEGSGLKFGAGLDTVIPEILSGSVVALAETIYRATAHMKKGRPSQHQIDKFIENYEDLDDLITLVLKGLEESNVSKKKLSNWKETLNIA